MGRESENPAIADGVFCCCSIMHLFDSENISLAGKQKVPQMALRDFFAVLLVERHDSVTEQYQKLNKNEFKVMHRKMFNEFWSVENI